MNRQAQIRWAVSLLAAVTLAACKKPAAENILARVGDREIPVDEFSKLMAAKQRTNPVPIDPAQFLNEVTLRETYVQAARQAGFDKEPEVQEQIRDILAARVREKVLGAQLEAVTVSDAEVQRAYEAGRAEFSVPERAHLAVLFLEAPKGNATAIRQRLEAAQNQVRQVSNRQEQNFGALAVDFSEDQETRYRGGDLGWVERGRHPQRIERAAIEAGFALPEVGAVSDVIRGERGFYLVKLLGRQAPTVTPLEKVAPAIQARLLREKREQVEARFAAKVREAVTVEIHPERLPAANLAPANPLPPKLP